MRRILLSAGEASGDRLGAGLARAIRAAAPDVELVGMGGDEMAEAGVRLLQHASEVAVVGIVEVAKHLPAIRRAMNRLTRALTEEKPDLFVPIDFPDFNFRLAERASRAGVPIVYYVSPQVWAWRKGRVATLRRLVRRVLVLFPFEQPFYETAGVPATFVGHPAAARRERASRADLLPRLGLDPGRPVVALLPGSRAGEAGRILPVLLEGGARLQERRPGLQLAVPVARTLPAGLVDGILERSKAQGVRVVRDAYPGILEVADAGAVASGTATLDAALAGLPFLAVYKMQPLTFLIARSLIRVDHIALPNLVAGEGVVPELIQGAFTGEAVARGIGELLDDPGRAEAMRLRLAVVRDRLRGEGSFERAAEAVLAELAKGPV
ncbi:MAG TPA: lipid-A-disaccharide synthase [Candidatus Bathyarchaeia archaeon]|nr:lipid-A-disaccharide synthase [Candidatus Bathyarchaeia archaeon]